MKNYLAALVIVGLFIDYYFEVTNDLKKAQLSGNSQITGTPDCLHLYFDFGTNVGIQIRKLFEPELYPGSQILPIFDSYFGYLLERRDPGVVCAIGVEPNSAHEVRLMKLEAAYNNHSWYTKIFTRTGIGLTSGWMLLKSDGDKTNHEWGAQLVDDVKEINEETPGAVRVLDVVEIMREYLDMNGSVYSTTSSNRKVVVKVDIEGMDENVIHYLKTSGTLCRIDYMYVEHMHMDKIKSLNADLLLEGCHTSVVYMDDEEYHNSDFPLPS